MSAIEFKIGVIRPVECFKEGWELIKDRYWLFFGVSIVGALIAGFSMYILLGAMFCGTFYCFFQKYYNQPFSFADLFKGFDYFMPSLIVGLFFIVPNLLITFLNIVFQVAAPMLIRENIGGSDLIWTILTVYLAIVLVLAIIMACVHALIIFAFPLIVEYKLSAVEAIKTSARAAWSNMGGVIGLILCQFGLMIAGVFACYFGLFFVFPLMYAGVFVAYRKVFPPPEIGNFDAPPPPSAFQNAGHAI